MGAPFDKLRVNKK